jgi:hypothetical protein
MLMNILFFRTGFALLKTSLSILLRLTAEGVGQHLESGFGQQLSGFA